MLKKSFTIVKHLLDQSRTFSYVQDSFAGPKDFVDKSKTLSCAQGSFAVPKVPVDKSETAFLSLNISWISQGHFLKLMISFSLSSRFLWIGQEPMWYAQDGGGGFQAWLTNQTLRFKLQFSVSVDDKHRVSEVCFVKRESATTVQYTPACCVRTNPRRVHRALRGSWNALSYAPQHLMSSLLTLE